MHPQVTLAVVDGPVHPGLGHAPLGDAPSQGKRYGNYMFIICPFYKHTLPSAGAHAMPPASVLPETPAGACLHTGLFQYICCPPSIPRGRTLRARDREVVVELDTCSVPWQIYNNMQVHGHFYTHGHIPTYSVTYTRHTHTTLLENRTGIGRQEYPKENSTVPPHSRQRVS